MVLCHLGNIDSCNVNTPETMHATVMNPYPTLVLILLFTWETDAHPIRHTDRCTCFCPDLVIVVQVPIPYVSYPLFASSLYTFVFLVV